MVSAPTAVGVPFTRQEERRFAGGAKWWGLLEAASYIWSDDDPADQPEDPTQRHIEDWDREKLDDLNFVK